MKDNLAMFDILAHNNWKRPICFTVTVGPENLIGLQPYLYKEGFTYRLIPYKVDTAAHDQMEKVNTDSMYNAVMNKFKWGHFATAKYLDHESTTMFYPVMLTTFLDLTQDLIQHNKLDSARKVLQKYDTELPHLNPYIDVAARKYYLAQAAYGIKDYVVADHIVKDVDSYLADQLDFYYYEYKEKNSTDDYSMRDLNIGIQLIGGLAEFAKTAHETKLAAKLEAQFKDYQNKFAPLLSRQQ